MFESILEKYIINNFGQFISGLDKNSLHFGVWNGNIIIENVNLKPDVLEMLEIPVNLRFSTIGKLQIQVPWSKLSSAPVEILLEKILIIANPRARKDWRFLDYNNVKRKLNLINTYAKSLIENYLKKKKDNNQKKEDKEGYFDRLSMKVLDNIQLTIRNIHFRFEDESAKVPFSFGITLDEIIIITADEKWNKSFIDRTDEKNKEKSMNKLLSLKNLGIYWNSRETNFLSSAEKELVISKLNSMILKENQNASTHSIEYIINISAEAKLIQNNKTDLKIPNYLLTINLKSIDLHLKNEQLEQIIRNFEIYIDYSKMLMIERKKVAEINSELKQEYQIKFFKLFPQLQKSDLKSLEIFTPEEKNQFEIILTSTSSEDLCDWTKKSIKQIQKDLKIQELEKLKKKNESSWWGWSGGPKEEGSSESLTSIEINEIEELIETTFSLQSDVSGLIRPQDSPWLEMKFFLEGGSIYLSKKNENNDQEGVKLKSSSFYLVLLNYYNGITLDIKLQDIGVDMITEYVGSKTPIITPILYRGIRSSKNEYFLQFLYEKNPFGRKEDQSVTCFMDSIELVFHPLAFNRVYSFFNVKTKDEAFKTAAWDQLEKISDTTQERVNDILSNSLKLKVKLEINAPLIIIPFLHNNDQRSECWLLDLGQCALVSEEFSEDEYERFKLQLISMKMLYFPRRKMVYDFLKNKPFIKNEESLESMKMSINDESQIFNVIQEFTINVEISKLKSVLIKDPIREKRNLSAIKLKFELPDFQINLNKKIYKDLINLPDTLYLSDINNLELMQTEKLSLVNSEIKSGMLKRRGKTFKAWHPYFVIFSGGYLYFFQNQKDLMPSFYLYIKKSHIIQTDAELTDEEFSFIIKVKNEEHYLACDTQKDLIDWIDVLTQKIQDYSLSVIQKDQLIINEITKQKKPTSKSIEHIDILSTKEILVESSFFVKRFKLNFKDENSKQKKHWLQLKLKGFLIEHTKRIFDFQINCRISALLVVDSLFKYNNPDFHKLVSNLPKTDNINNNQNSIEFKLISLEKQHSEYKNIDLDLELILHNLYVNWKPSTLLKLGEYIQILKNYKKTKMDAEILTEAYDLGNLKKSENLGRKIVNSKSNFPIMDSSEKTLLKARFIIEECTVNLLHRQTNTCLAQLYIKNSDVDLYLKNAMFEIDAKLGNVFVYDMTNYPKTIDSNIDYKLLKPYEILGGKGDSESFFRLKLVSLDNQSSILTDNITTYLDLEISSIVFKYHHQIVMRIVDYALVQIVSLITDSKYLTLNEQYYQENIEDVKKEPFKPKKFVGELEEVELRILYPTFLKLFISFVSPVILLKPTPDSEDYLELTISQVYLENEQYINEKRVEAKKKKNQTSNEEIKNENAYDSKQLDIWCENYKIIASDLHIYLIKEKTKSEIAIPVRLNLSVEKVLMCDEMKWILENYASEKSIENSFIIKGVISPIILKLYRDEYLFIIKMLFHNITFDDTKDSMFIYDFDLVSKYEPTPIFFQLDFLNITLYAMHFETNLPFSSITMEKMRLKWVRDVGYNVDVYIFGQEFSSNFYEKESGYLIEKGFIGSLGKADKHIVSDNIDRTYTFDLEKQIYKKYLNESGSGIHHNYIENKFEIENLNEIKAEFTLKVLMTPNGEKSIGIVFQDVKILAQTSVYMNLFYFAQLDESVYPVFEAGNILAMSIICEIKNAIVCIPIKHSKHVMVTRGDINVRYYRHRMKTMVLLLEEFFQNKNNPNRRDNIDSYSYSIELNKIEIFLCELKDLIRLKKFNQVRKRNIILPFSFFYGSKNYISLPASTKDCFYYIAETEVNFYHTIFRFSFKDLNLLIQMIKYQTEEFSKIENWQKTEIQPNDIVKVDYIDKDKTYSITLKRLQICIINDLEEAFVPVLDFTFNEGQINIINKSKTVVQAILSLSAFYFNPYVSHWEPFIEPIGFLVDLSYSPKNNPKYYVVIQTNDNYKDLININISLDMLKILQKTINLCTNSFNSFYQMKNEEENSAFLEESKEIHESGFKEIKEIKMQEKYQILEEDIVEYVSPYTIKNETGYPIELERDDILYKSSDSKSKFNLLNGHSMNFQFETNMDAILNREDKIRNHKKIKIKILNPLYEYETLQKIDMDVMRPRKHEIFHKEKLYSQFKSTIITSVSCLGSGKLLTITSELLFINLTNKKIQINLVEEKRSDIIDIAMGEKYVIPFDKIHKNIRFRYLSDELSVMMENEKESNLQNRAKWSDIYSLDKLMKNVNSCYQTSHAKYFTLIKIIKEKEIGRIIIYFEPPYTIKNCLPMEVTFRIISENKEKSPPLPLPIQQEFQEHNISLDSQVFLKLKLPGFEWSEKFVIYSSTNMNSPKLLLLNLEDSNKGRIFIEIIREEGLIDGTCKKFFLYSKFFVVNETPYNLFFSFNTEKRKYAIPGQYFDNSTSKIVLLGVNSKTIMVSFNHNINITSREINLNGIGSYSIELVNINSQNIPELHEFGVNLSNICVDRKNHIFSKILRISPRYIFVNRTPFDIQVRQEGCFKSSLLVCPELRIPFFWNENSKNKLINVSLVEIKENDQEVWGPSGSIDITALGVISFCIRNKKNLSIRYMQADIRIDSHILYVIFTECTVQTANYLIVNDLSDVRLIAYQNGCNRKDGIHINKNNFKMFGWEYPIREKIINIELEFENVQYAAEVASFYFDKIDSDEAKEFLVHSKHGTHFPSYRFMVSTFIEDSTKKLRFFKDDPVLEKYKKEDKINLQLQITCKEIGVSLIGEYNKKRIEIMYIYFFNPEFFILESQISRTTQLRVKYINIDNASSENTIFPVAFTPTKLEDIQRKENKFHLDMCLDQNIMANNILLFKSIRALLQPCTIRVNDELMDIIRSFMEECSILFQSSSVSPQTLVQKLYSDFEARTYNFDLPEYEWQTTPLPLDIKHIYIGELILSPIYLNASFQTKPKSQKSDPFFVMTFLNALGIALSNIDDAPINLNGIKLCNFFDATDGLLTKLTIHYKEALLNSLFQVVGSIDILGNPFGLMKHLAVGVFDLIDKPIEGFVKGPLEGGFGIAKGAGSFLKNTVAGTFNSVQKITGSFATGISSLSLDDEYLAQREKSKMKKPKHLLDGIGQGALSIFNGLEKGFTGVFSKPYEGAKKSGIGGFFKGSVHGLAGLLVKPIAGVFDATSKTAEGIKNTATHFDDKPNDKRIRVPRVFYSKEAFIKCYSDLDSEILHTMRNNKKEKMQKVVMVENFNIKDDKNSSSLTFFENSFGAFEGSKMQFFIKIKNINNFEIEVEGIRIFVKKESKKNKGREFMLKIKNIQEKEDIYELLLKLIESFKESKLLSYKNK